MASCVKNIHAKNYQNLIIGFQVTVENVELQLCHLLVYDGVMIAVCTQDDTLTHLYTLIVKPDNTYVVKIDNKKEESGTLEADWDFLAPKTIKV